MIETQKEQERALLVGVELQQTDNFDMSMEELASLAKTAGALVKGVYTQKREKYDSKTFVGSGKLDEIAQMVEADEIDTVIVNNRLTPRQNVNLEDILGVKVIDRMQLILDIFAMRAQSHEGKLQVHLAQLKYMLPRLVGQGIMLSRQAGGIGSRGPGESQGRVHTSTATVLIMPEVEEVEYDIDPKDLRVDIYHASGAGGQNVNKVATAVRIVHLPTNIKVELQEERTQQKNREKAMKIIRARVADHFAQIAQDEQDAERKSTIGTGDRSERIRTYNFPQNRVTDHRIGLTLQKLDTILSGKMDEVVDALVLYDQTQKLEELNK